MEMLSNFSTSYKVIKTLSDGESGTVGSFTLVNNSPVEIYVNGRKRPDTKLETYIRRRYGREISSIHLVQEGETTKLLVIFDTDKPSYGDDGLLLFENIKLFVKPISLLSDINEHMITLNESSTAPTLSGMYKMWKIPYLMFS